MKPVDYLTDCHLPRKFPAALLLSFCFTCVGFAQIPPTSAVPDGLLEPTRMLLSADRVTIEAVRGLLRERAIEHNNNCKPAPNDPTAKAQCRESQKDFTSDAADFVLKVNEFNLKVASAKEVAIKALRERLPLITRQVEMDKTAIRNLGFKTRESEFRDWAKLSETAKSEFEGQVFDLLADAVQKKMLASFKGFDKSAAEGLIGKLSFGGLNDPKLSQLLMHIAENPDRAAVAADAALAVKSIQGLAKVSNSAAQGKDLAALSSVLEFLVEDPQLKLLLIDLKFTTASLYNNATRRVSMAQIEKLTKLTEDELKNLDVLRCVMQRHVGERFKVEKDLASVEDRVFTEPPPLIADECK